MTSLSTRLKKKLYNGNDVSEGKSMLRVWLIMMTLANSFDIFFFVKCKPFSR
eukprot:CAMPEP_0201103348 /NCGR_PEP_ID=MMETSP0812-20130820/28426_1 /ASSEMBLY_ACC=CAM_ASM_000668 /TAXON_ID=98059 /ORGANISM="Dinobryon sp., Strain UTEXLB2267" /LENGTH=51 /DNA_ID=CAMNT_0047361553 /DNA_START=224 /DNA_END=379 /DNA_ORIENTATION=+